MHAESDSLNQALDSLKDFQRATVTHVYRSLFHERRKAMLVADEVGLGKTIVARGVIATALQAAAARGDTSFRVTYVCSNQAIARENEQKLNPFPEKNFRPQTIRRMAYLAYKPSNENPAPNGVTFELNSLTPSTSFESRSSTGTAKEREVIGYLLMNGDDLFAAHPEGVACILKGEVGQDALKQWVLDNVTEWQDEGERFRYGLANEYTQSLGDIGWSKDVDLPEMLTAFKEQSLLAIAKYLAQTVTLATEPVYGKLCTWLVAQLRAVLIEKCATFLKTDLFILDEFQRFKQLIEMPETGDEGLSQAARVANLAFTQPEARVLMLSATPFKAFSGDVAEETEDAHYKEFEVVLRFLLRETPDDLQRYESARRQLYHQFGLLTSRSLNQIDTSAKREIEAILRPIMCRTERISFTNLAGRIQARDAEPLQVTAHDIATYIDSDRVMAAIGTSASKPDLAMPVDYCKSSPYPFSFLRGYKLHGEVAEGLPASSLGSSTHVGSAAWLPIARIDGYEPVISGEHQHARLRALMDMVFQNNAHLLLWIPPSLPYYPMQGVFADSKGYSKTLVFSAWRLVPRMIAALTSYEVERRTIGDERTRDPAREQSVRRYFPDTSESGAAQRRRPNPQIVFRVSQRGPLQEVQNSAEKCNEWNPDSLGSLRDFDLFWQ